MLSKFTKTIQLSDDVFAIYNNLVMDIILLTKSECEVVMQNSVTPPSLETALYDAGIYISDESQDEMALKVIIDKYNESVGLIEIIYLILTNDCNLRCRYCFLENNKLCPAERGKMSLDTAVYSINKYVKYLQKNNLTSATLMLYGGEPTLEIELVKQVISYCRHSPINFDINIITNGTLISPEVAAFFHTNNVTIGLSLDGPKEITNYNRKFKNSDIGAFDVIWKSKQILDDTGCNYGLSMVVSDYFLKNSKDVLDWLANYHEKGIYFNLLHFDSPVEDWKTYAYESAQFITKAYEYLEEQESFIADGRIQRQINSYINQDFMFADCGAVGCNQISVLPDGNICICHGDTSDTEHHIGSIFSIDLNTIKDSTEARFWINKATIKNSQCLNCEALFCCGGGCPHHAAILFGERGATDEAYCQYAKFVLRWMLQRSLYKDVQESSEN